MAAEKYRPRSSLSLCIDTLMGRICDKIAQRQLEGTLPYFSFEYFPPRTDEGVKNLYKRIERMAQQGDAS